MQTVRGLIGVIGVFTIGCEGSLPTAELMRGFDPGPPPENGLQIILPIVKAIPAGTSVELCTWTDQIVQQDTSIKTLQSFQSAGGHHFVVFSTIQHRPPGSTRPCRVTDMASFNFIAGTGGGEGFSNDVDTAPGNLVSVIRAGSQIVIDHHYINATAHPMDAQSAADLVFPPRGDDYVKSGWVFFLDAGMSLYQGPQSLHVRCSVPTAFAAWRAAPHMHRFGTSLTVDVTRGGQTTRFFDITPWSSDYVFHSPERRATDLDHPMQFFQGDIIDLHCQWNITDTGPITFGAEMCVLAFETLHSFDGHDLVCNGGAWIDY